ncbi:WD40-repeat-containing domain superfamily [Babesia duncani]|uniref:WD40-repeat-containing domain superfamily n=1 Tax=Babesia duncani TaxID=323732 RepID=A0AAD9PP91_9APIC|nr:WD40-repeat-containing domain superfamily [Babesia duncani]
MATDLEGLNPFNGSFAFDRELIGHQRGARCGCCIDQEHISCLVGSQSIIESAAAFGFEYLITGGVDGDVLVWKCTPEGSIELLHMFLAHVNTVMAICPSRLLNDLHDPELEGLDPTRVSFVDAALCIYTAGRDKLIHRYTLLGRKLLTLDVCCMHPILIYRGTMMSFAVL